LYIWMRKRRSSLLEGGFAEIAGLAIVQSFDVELRSISNPGAAGCVYSNTHIYLCSTCLWSGL